MLKYFSFIPIYILLQYSIVEAQNYKALYQSNFIEVRDSSNRVLSNAFGGGLKFPLFGQMDLNNDYIFDLVVFDRADNQLLTFVNSGKKDTVDYLYRPQFEVFFPDIFKLLILKDYNNDGKPDLFALSKKYNSGIEVYRNKSTEWEIKFEKITSQITAWYFNSAESGIYLNSIDLPVLEDIDHDGDMDIVTFSILGGLADYFENLSMDLYGKPDSLKYEYADQCWGKIMESDSSNRLDLGISCPAVRGNPFQKRHAGSTMTLTDIDDDGDYDLLLGDVGYPELLYLKNGRKEFHLNYDSMIGLSLFPDSLSPVKIRNMPAAFLIDVNNDGRKDMIISPQDQEKIDTFQALNQVWLYLDKSGQGNPDFKKISTAFLQEDMIDLGGPTKPAFFDFDADGDDDMFVATSGDFSKTNWKKDRIVLFENTGTAKHASFKLVNDNWLNLSAKGYRFLVPAFGDVDGDGDMDLLLGKEDGTLSCYRNEAGAGNPASFVFVTDFYASIDVGAYSAPAIADIDGNSLADLIVGEEDGNLNYYRNIGMPNAPNHVFVTDTFGNVVFPLPERQFTSPVIYDLDKNGMTDLILGTRTGNLYFYPDIKNYLSGSFSVVEGIIRDSLSNSKLLKPLGYRIHPAFANLDGDNYPDLVLGGERGGLILYSTVFDSINVSVENKRFETDDIKVWPNPSDRILHIKANGISSIILTDVFGRQHLQTTFTESINISSLKNGLYIMILMNENGLPVTTKKILKYN